MGAGHIDAFFHFADGLGQADKDGPADDAVTDVQLRHAFEPRDRTDILIVEAVPGMQFHAGGEGSDGRGFQGVELAIAIASLWRVGVTPGVQLDSGRAQLDGGFDLFGIGIDEKSNVDARVAAARHGLGNAIALADNVEAPLGGQLLPAFGDERDLVGLELEGQGDDARLDRQFQVQANLDGLPQQAEVAVLDVAAVLTQVDGDPVGPAELGQHGGPDRVGLAAPAA